MGGRVRRPAIKALFLIPPALSALLLIDLCSLLFRCGCRPMWAGASEYCNIHVAGVHHCPWCSHGMAGYVGVLLLVLIPQVVLSFYPIGWSWRKRFIVSLSVFPAAGTVVALAFGFADGYWTF